MGRRANLKKDLEKLEQFIKEKKDLENNKERILSDLYKHETLYLEITQGTPLIKTSEFYVNSRVEKKKVAITEKDRIFSIEYPSNSI